MSTFISVGTFSVYVLLGNELTAHLIFPSLSIFASLSWIILQVGLQHLEGAFPPSGPLPGATGHRDLPIPAYGLVPLRRLTRQ